ncbi:MAG: carboxypeptidase-like regulatory domain-containing protein, partial [Pyrinomonadaceae bacterium]|nr:carboxypeptidase-like regulatory domain-containing protein [Pyrinomonadaceae bacterium]
MSRIVRLSFLVLIVLATSYAALGQSTVAGAIRGVVTNPNKEVVPGASVAVKNLGTNAEETATTDEQGGFRITNLQPN